MPEIFRNQILLITCDKPTESRRCAALDYVAAKDSFPVQANVTTEFQQGQGQHCHSRDVKKLCCSQDPVKLNSRCATVSINWLLQLFWLCSLFLYFQVRARNRWTSHLRWPFGRGWGWVKFCTGFSCRSRSFEQWIFTWITISSFEIMSIIIQIITIIVK